MKWFVRVVAGLIFLWAHLIALNLVLVFGFGLWIFNAAPQPPVFHILPALVIVVIVFGIDLFVLWLLTKIGGPLKADVKATVKKFGGSFVLTTTGLIGAFLALLIATIAALYVVSRFL